MKQFKSVFVFFMMLSGCKFRYDTGDPLPRPYKSVEISKENNAFINEYLPQSPFLRIAGNSYRIKEAWLEHPHKVKTFNDALTEDEALVIEFYYDTSYHADLKEYVKEMGNGVSTIWFNLYPENYTDSSLKQINDTIVMHYRETLDSFKKNKTFYFFKKEIKQN